MKGTAEGYCGEKTLTNFGESFKFDTTLNVQFYMNDTHDTSKYLLFEGTVSGPGSASVNTSAFCNMKVRTRAHKKNHSVVMLVRYFNFALLLANQLMRFVYRSICGGLARVRLMRCPSTPFSLTT
jgi:hypothetical protein